MSIWHHLYIVTFLAGAALTLAATPVFKVIAEKLDFMDRPQANHKGHARATALLGGAAMFTVWVICIAAALLALHFGLLPGIGAVVNSHLGGIGSSLPRLAVLVCGGFLCAALGLVDDKWAMSAGVKFAGQFAIAAFVTVYGGLRLNLFIGNDAAAAAVTVFWIMLMMNSVNFFDNMDGLAVGTIAVSMLVFTVAAAINRQFLVGLLAALNCGICCGFWFYNASPAVIFMGDSGSHFLGYLAAVTAAAISWFGKDFSLSRFPVLIPFFALALPLFDTAMVVAIRTRNRKPFWIGDHNHISHRFVRMGLSRRLAVILVHLMALCLGLGALPMLWSNFATAALLAGQSVIMIAVITVIQLALSERKDARETGKDPENGKPEK